MQTLLVEEKTGRKNNSLHRYNLITIFSKPEVDGFQCREIQSAEAHAAPFTREKAGTAARSPTPGVARVCFSAQPLFSTSYETVRQP